MKVSTTCQEQLKLFRADISPYQAHNFAALEKAQLEAQGCLYVDSIDHADILITNTHTNLERFTPDQLEQIKLIIHPNSGYDNFSPNVVKKINAPIVLGNRIRAGSVAAYTLACLHQAIGAVPWSHSWDKSRSWPRRSLEKMHIQIIGYGHIGTLVQQSLQPLVDSIFIYDPYRGKDQLELERSDVIILCCGLNSSSIHFLDKAKLSQLKHNAIVINPARGKLINTKDLIHWLTKKPKACAFLDVFEDEPCDLSAFPSNAKCTSHIAGVDDDLDHRIITFVIDVISDFKSNPLPDFTHKWSDAILSNRIIDGKFI